jgi:hypothetical protein
MGGSDGWGGGGRQGIYVALKWGWQMSFNSHADFDQVAARR